MGSDQIQLASIEPAPFPLSPLLAGSRTCGGGKFEEGSWRQQGEEEEGAGRQTWWRSVKRWCEDGRGRGIDAFLDLCCEEEGGIVVVGGFYREHREKKKLGDCSWSFADYREIKRLLIVGFFGIGRRKRGTMRLVDVAVV